ncbi:aspartate/glutamate racemase family protein [Nocardia sp. NPDC127606]|uniref:aspartate/glutamate racemase family protein n=1 Tax=Nocardia sp. NPDC127606 TaxID=3345406 RepID=UPI0036279620
METKILWQYDSTFEQTGGGSSAEDKELILKNMLEFAKSVARPTTEIVMDFPNRAVGKHFAGYMRYNRALLAVEILERVKQAELDGFDAAFPGVCYGEFFLQDARQAVKIPVVGPAESAMVMAQLIGANFAVVTMATEDVHIQGPVYGHNVVEQNLRLLGWENRAIKNRPVRPFLPPLASLLIEAYKGKPDRLIEEFEKHALACVRDGADVVICGCMPYGTALSKVGYNEVANTGVPVVTPLPAMIKLAESLVDLRRSVGIAKSEAVISPYRSTPDEVLEDLATRGIGMPEVRKPDQALASAYDPTRSREIATH